MSSISIYIHWPFCLSLCPYCDFNSHIANNIDHKKWQEAYLQELNYFSSKVKGKEIKSIFFGGGTPSLMQPVVVEAIINQIASLGKISASCEITLEANPTSFEINKFKQFKNAGINRVSIGVQSFNEQDLIALGRKHSPDEAIFAITEASKIFDRYSFDLIYATSKQTLVSWQEELKFALTLAGGHISLYQLTIEKGTPFFKLFRSGELSLPSNDLAAELYEWTNSFLAQHGYNRYEISNYSIPEQECIHNLCYWNYDEYIGIGPGAHSRLQEKYSDSIKVSEVSALMMYHKPSKWLDSVNTHGHGIQNNLNLSKEEVIEELILMGSRLSKGLHESNLQKKSGLNFEDIFNQEILQYYIQKRLVSVKDRVLKLSNHGLLVHNYLIPRLLKI